MTEQPQTPETPERDEWPASYANYGLLSNQRQRLKHIEAPPPPRSRPYALGGGLFLALLAFWVLDSLKDPVLGALTNGNLERHQPTAKLVSVFTTLGLVCFLEYVLSSSNEQQPTERTGILDEGGTWTKMDLELPNNTHQDRVPDAIFVNVGVPYCLLFAFMAYLLQFHPSSALEHTTATTLESNSQVWHIVGYVFYAAVESYGSIAVATFWSFTNTTLTLHEAESSYGTIIAIAQLGAILGSSMVSAHLWNNITLMVLACLFILLQILWMSLYNRRYSSTTTTTVDASFASDRGGPTNPLWSGVYLILQHNYVLLILGVSCLYEVSLTCLNYQMTLLGWSRFDESTSSMTFVQFMGHYGQLVNVTSLFLSSVVFPRLIQRWGLRYTLRLFPTLLLLVNLIAFGAAPGNLSVLFVSLSLLKAMTYSIHDPSKELLYLPTSNPIKFQAKFWIDVVGARIAKAAGSGLNQLSGSVDRSIRVASAPSVCTALALGWVCWKAGILFDRLVAEDTIVGVNDVDDPNYTMEGGILDHPDDDDDDEEMEDQAVEEHETPLRHD